MIKKIGFACKWSELDSKGQVVSVPELNTRSTTAAWLNRQSEQIAEERLWDIVKHNIEATRKLVEKVGGLPDELRMVRLSSDILPMYTHSKWSYFYRLSDVRGYCESAFRRVGDLAKSNSVRLSMHPGQFCVLASDNGDVVDRSIEEFEYHATMAAWMGFGQEFQDFKINVHIAGRAGPEGFREAYTRLSPEARNCITIENEEITYGLDDCLSLADVVPIVLDIHHHWCKTGEYLSAMDPRVGDIIRSWRGVRPTCHYSVSREDILVGHDAIIPPDSYQLSIQGHKTQKLRAHSEYYWNTGVNEWASSFRHNFDIMCESKAKNLASFKFYESIK
jgi:UV damage endonuclease UvdE